MSCGNEKSRSRALPVQKVSLASEPTDWIATWNVKSYDVSSVSWSRASAAGSWCGSAPARQRVSQNDPGADGCAEVLGRKGPQRHVLPGLDAPRAPVVHQDEALICSSASSIRTGSPRTLGLQMKAASSSSISSLFEGLKTGVLGVAVGSARIWPCGRLIEVPKTTTLDARPW